QQCYIIFHGIWLASWIHPLWRRSHSLCSMGSPVISGVCCVKSWYNNGYGCTIRKQRCLPGFQLLPRCPGRPLSRGNLPYTILEVFIGLTEKQCYGHSSGATRD